MNRLSQAIVMLLFGGALIKTTVTDVFLRYVKAGLRPFLLTAGILLVAAAIMTIWYELRAAPAGHDHETDDGHGHAHHEPRIGWLLILPVISLLLITPPALGSYSAGQAGTVALTAGDSDYPPLPAADPAPLGLIDYASRAIFDGGKSLTGHTVQMSGFLTPGPDKKPMLARIVLTCCAADGRPIKIGLNGDVTVDAPTNSWIEVNGVYSPQVGTDPVNKAKVAYLTVTSWQQISEPANPYS
ncbi:TIGR03943 family putative permease subunit [Actinoplanes sp. CA-030573]|uniref:TIGR03943 family putative permease subunit n=1 Tax=Actinoplanes sp. CA-030573 TaxID=3239898 RepID=UPI003D8BFF27